MGLDRPDERLPVLVDRLGLLPDHVEHGRHARAVNVRVDKADAMAPAGRLDSELW